jgi:hypothetical protein
MKITIASIDYVDLSDIDDLLKEFGCKSSMSVKKGDENFSKWHRGFDGKKL